MQDDYRISGAFLERGVREAIFADLDVPNKASALRTIARIMGEAKGFGRDVIETIANAMIAREELCSTGLGEGVANPHTRHPSVLRPLVGWFVVRPAIEFDALDGEPVWLIICMIVAQNQPGDHLRQLEAVNSLFKNTSVISAASQGAASLNGFLCELAERRERPDPTRREA